MGRRAGVTAEDTRRHLLAAAAKVFARRGYDGASIAEITSEAGLSSGAVYAQFGSKGQLFAATLRSHGPHELDRLLGKSDEVDVAGLLTAIGSTFDRRSPTAASLLVEAIVAAKRDPEVAALLHAAIAEHEKRLAGLVRGGQDEGAIVDEVSAESLARLALMVGLGSKLVGALRLPPPDHEDWAVLIARLVDAFRTPTEEADAP